MLDEAKDSVTSIHVSDHEILTASADCQLRQYDLRNGLLHTDYIGCMLILSSHQCCSQGEHHYPNIFGRERHSPNNTSTRENGDTAAFPQIGITVPVSQTSLKICLPTLQYSEVRCKIAPPLNV